MSDLVTGEAVPLELRLAKLPSRALALMVDERVLLLVAGLVALTISSASVSIDPALAGALSIGLLVFVLVIVPTTVETLSHGKSLGKAIYGLRVVRDDGGPIRFRHALVRALAGVFADFVVTLGVGALLCSLLNSKGKRIGDVLAGTMVIRERIPTVPAPAPVVDPRLANWAVTLELSQLPDHLALAARTLLARAHQLAPEVGNRLAADLASQIAALVSPPPPTGTGAWHYLAAVLSERRRRDSIRYAAAAPQPLAPPPSTPAPASPSQPPPTSDDGFAPPA